LTFAFLLACAASGTVRADQGLVLDLSTLLFNYQATNPHAQPGEVIGTLSINDRPFSNLTLQQLDLGPDGKIGGGDDIVLDLAGIGLGESFDALFAGDVIKQAGNNNYLISGRFAATDTVTSIAEPSLLGDFESSDIAIFEGVFLYIGPWSPADDNDSILLPSGVPSWEFHGILGDTPATPNKDGIRGQVSLPSGRSAFKDGRLAEFHIETGIPNLDTFFAVDRRNLASDVKATVVPEPTTFLLLLAGMLAVLARCMYSRRLRVYS